MNRFLSLSGLLAEPTIFGYDFICVYNSSVLSYCCLHVNCRIRSVRLLFFSCCNRRPLHLLVTQYIATLICGSDPKPLKCSFWSCVHSIDALSLFRTRVFVSDMCVETNSIHCGFVFICNDKNLSDIFGILALFA